MAKNLQNFCFRAPCGIMVRFSDAFLKLHLNRYEDVKRHFYIFIVLTVPLQHPINLIFDIFCNFCTSFFQLIS